MSTYAGYRPTHPFPGCFVCGTDRPPPDGLGLRPGRLPDRPDMRGHDVGCPTRRSRGADGAAARRGWSGPRWTAQEGGPADLAGRPMVLGRMTAAVDALPQAGDPCVVMGRWLGAERRKTFTASTLYDG